MSITTDFLHTVIALRPETNGIDRYSYMLANTREFESAPMTDAEREYVDMFNWDSHLPRECFANAQVVAWATRYIGPPEGIDIKYVEGYVLVAECPLPIDHAWISVNGKVLDTTLKVIGTIPDGWEYLGVELPLQAVDHAIVDHEAHISLLDDYACGWPLLQSATAVQA